MTKRRFLQRHIMPPTASLIGTVKRLPQVVVEDVAELGQWLNCDHSSRGRTENFLEIRAQERTRGGTYRAMLHVDRSILQFCDFFSAEIIREIFRKEVAFV